MATIKCFHVKQPGDADSVDFQLDELISSMPPLSVNELARRVRLCEQTNDSHALDEVISLHYKALKYCGTTQLDRKKLLNSLGCAVYRHFQHRGSDKDLDEAIMLHREALSLRSVGHLGRPKSLNNLANILHKRFQYQGINDDLDEAVVLHREALTLRPVGHPDRAGSQNNLANTLHKRFQHQGSDKDLDEAIMLHREALTLRPVGHPDRPLSLNNLASILHKCFERRGSDKDLNEVIMLSREALTLRPVGHLDRPLSLGNLANALYKCFQHRGGDKDLDEATMLHREALALCPVGHPDRPQSLHNLARVLNERFQHQGGQQDVNDALANAYSALTLSKAHDPILAQINGLLADIHLSLYRSGLNSTANDTDDLNAAIHHLKVAADSVSSGLLNRLRRSLQWVDIADKYTHHTLLEAYANSIQLLDAHMSATASVSSRHHVMKLIPPSFTVNPASIALHNGEVSRAVELLEKGRTLIWTQMARFRTPLDTLKEDNSHAKALVKRFRELSSILDQYPEAREETSRVKEEAEAVRYSRLVNEWSGVVEEIRKVDGFSRFMLPPLFSDLQDAARDGPVIIPIASKLSCDAIIVMHHTLRFAYDLVPMSKNSCAWKTSSRAQSRECPILRKNSRG